MNQLRRRLASLLIVVSIVAGSQGVSRAVFSSGWEELEGDWAGWMYRENGDDPLRLRFRSSEDGSVFVLMDLPSMRRYDLEPTMLRIGDSQFAFRLEPSAGQVFSFQGRIEGSTITGTLDWNGAAGTFDLERATYALSQIEPQSYEDLQGFYMLAPRGRIMIESWFWGELRYKDVETGKRGTLFSANESAFFSGEGQYIPGPSPALIEASFIKDAEGRPRHIVWKRNGEPPLVGTRLALTEHEAHFTNDNASLSGTVILPEGDGPHPAVVVLGGSGWRTRNFNRGEAYILASAGVAALIYDKRGNGESTGDVDVSFETTARDAIAGATYLSRRSDIDASRIGVMGTSRAGWFAPLATTLSDVFSFAILVVAPAVSPAEQETMRRLNIMRDAGMAEPDIAQARRYLQLMWGYGSTGNGWDEYAAARQDVFAKGWTFLGGPETRDPSAWLWMKMNMQHDPIPVLENMTVPVLAIFGGADRNVVPGVNLPLMEAALRRAGNGDVTATVIPEANHVMQVVTPDRAAPPFHREVGYTPELWRIILGWLEQRLALK